MGLRRLPRKYGTGPIGDDGRMLCRISQRREHPPYCVECAGRLFLCPLVDELGYRRSFADPCGRFRHDEIHARDAGETL